MIINGIAILPKFKNSNGFNWMPKQIIPNFNIYSLVKSKPFWKVSPTLKTFPKIIPKIIAIIAVDIGLFSYPKSSIPMMLLKPWESV